VPGAVEIPNRPAIAGLIARHLPRVRRIAVALTADRDSGESVTQAVIRAAVRKSSRWADDAEAARWFNHFTVLVARRFPPHRAGLRMDTGFSSLVQTLYALPHQQREAFVLRHGEDLDLRQIATAMDCSASAASNHLVAAAEALRAVSDGRLGDFTTALPAAIAAFGPPAGDLDQWIAVQVRRSIRRKLVGSLREWVLVACVVTAMAAGGWLIWKMTRLD
jgi:DNA-directed RNA polymerase specialized sigma24 family protein